MCGREPSIRLPASLRAAENGSTAATEGGSFPRPCDRRSYGECPNLLPQGEAPMAERPDPSAQQLRGSRHIQELRHSVISGRDEAESAVGALPCGQEDT